MASSWDKIPKALSLRRYGKETPLDIARRDSKYRKGLLLDGVWFFLDGQVELGKSSLRTYIKAKIGYDGLSEYTGLPSEYLKAMFSRDSNPEVQELFEVIRKMQRREGIQLEVKAVPRFKTKWRRKRENARRKLRNARSHRLHYHPQAAGDERAGAGAAG